MRFRNLSWLVVSLIALNCAAAAAPVVSSLNPGSGPVGTHVQVSGSGFGATQGTSTVAFGGGNGTVVSWSDTLITAAVPVSAVTGSVYVIVGGSSSNTTVFFIVPAPQITSISPSSGAVGTQVTIAGSGFQSSKGL